jgi:small subunit ribosomal protein S2
MAQVTMKEMLDAGVHFGHQTQRWNPKMKPYVYGDRGGIHIIDLQKSVVRAKQAAEFAREIAANGGRIMFVGTKKQAVEPIKEAAAKCGQYFIVKRWLGGTLTNFATVKVSIDRLKKIDQMREKGELEYYSKKERAGIDKEYLRLTEFFEGIREMKEPPSALFVVDLNKEHIAVAEAKRLKIAVIGIADTNSNPESIEYPIPGNDDAIRSIKLFANLVADSFLEGAKDYEMKLRSQTDKKSDTQKEEAPAPRRARGPKPEAQQQQPAAGPVVAKFTKKRKLVAAGTADDVEIMAELENADTEKPAEETEETPNE